MQCEDIADDGAHDENHAHRVHLYEFFPKAGGLRLGGAGRLEVDQDDEGR